MSLDAIRCVRLPASLAAELEAEARELDISFSQLVRRILMADRPDRIAVLEAEIERLKTHRHVTGLDYSGRPLE